MFFKNKRFSSEDCLYLFSFKKLIYWMNKLYRIVVLLLMMLAPALSHAQLAAGFTATPITGCAPLIVQFYNTSTGNPTTYQWNFGNAASSVLQNPSTTYTAPGTYTVTLTVGNGTTTNTKSITNYITVLGKPIVDFNTPDTVGCPPLTVHFTNATIPVTPGPATYSWGFGDGYTSTLQNPNHTYPSSGYYSITLVATNSGGCTSSLTKTNYIHVLVPPVANFTGTPLNYCNTPDTVHFTSTVTGTNTPYTYAWAFGNGNTAVTANPVNLYAASGAYTVSLVVTDAKGCKDTVVKPGYITAGQLTAGFTPSPSSGCVNTPLTFNSTSIGATNLIWKFGDGSTPVSTTSTSVTHVYTTAGTYTVKLIAQNSPCADSFSFPVVIHPQPQAQFSFLPTKPCPAPSTIQFTNTSVGAASSVWYFGDGSSSNSTSPSHIYNQNGYYSPMLVITSGYGCADSVSYHDSLKIRDLELGAGVVPAQGCAPLTVHFSSSAYTNIPYNGNSYPYPVATYNWNFGNGNTSTLDTPATTYNTPGSYTITLTVTTVNGCTATDTIHVLVGPHPTASFTASPDTVCNHSPVFFHNTSTNATTYLWDFGDGGSTGATSPSHPYSPSGIYTVTLHAYNNGCEDTFMVPNMIVVHDPTSKFYVKYNCDTPLMVKFVDTATVGATSRLWWFGDGATSTSIKPIHTYATAGTYNVSLISYNNVYGCSDTMTIPVKVLDPVASFVASDTTICKDDTITLTSSYTSPNIMQIDWQVGSQVLTDTLASIQYSFHTTGYFSVKVRIQDEHLCWDTFRRNNYILVAKPTAHFVGSPVIGCAPLSVTFTDQSVATTGTNIISRNWSYSNGVTATGSPVTSVFQAGVYDVSLIVTDNIGCKDTLAKPAYIDSRKPIAQFSANDTASCIGTGITFSNTSSGNGLVCSWSFGDGGTSTAYAPVHAYNQTGNFTVKLVLTDATGCKDSLVKNAYINISKPTAAFTMSDTLAICPPLNVTFTNNSVGATNYTWDFGNGSGSALTSPTSIYTTAGIYNISLIAINAEGCLDTATSNAKVLGYAGGLTYTPLTGCVPLLVHFTANLTNVPSIVWDFSDGVTTPANGIDTISHTYTTLGAYIPKLILSDGAGCLNSSDGIDTIKVDGVLPGFINSPACVNSPIVFTDTSFSFFSPINAWQWNVNNGSLTGNAHAITYIFSFVGTYPVTLIAINAHGCKDTVTKTITINPLPVINAGLDTSVCIGDAATLTANGGVSYIWVPVANLSCPTCQTTNATPTSATVYTVTGTDNLGCKNTDNVTVNIQTITTSTAANGGEICDDSSFHLFVSGAQHYEWKPSASLDNNLIPDPVASPHVTTVYTVLAWEGSCPPDSHQVKVTVWPKPIVSAGNDETIVAGGSVMLQATGSNLAQFNWSPITTLSCETCSNPVARPSVTTKYKVVATSIKGCKNSDSVVVYVICDKGQLFIPNLFSPNNDGMNDVFYPRGVGLKEITSFTIFNRWGEVVFEKNNMALNDESMGWDGTFKGKALPPDVYVYMLDGICETGEKISWKGDISLVR
jgi:gliding motility-associated-like protein